MKYVVKILELVSTLGTPTFHRNLGELIKTATKSKSLIVVRNIEKKYIILDAQEIQIANLEYNSLEELIEEYQLPEIYDFENQTFVICDGYFETEEIPLLLNQCFQKEAELHEKNRLMTVIDRLSYQLSAIESLVLNLSEPKQEDTFIDIIQSSLSEMLFCSVHTYKVDNGNIEKVNKIGFLDIDVKLEMNEILYSCIEMNLPLILDDTNEMQELKQNSVKTIIPIGVIEKPSFLLFIVRDTKIEDEEKLFIDTILKIMQHFYYKHFIELLDFKDKISLNNLKLLNIFDNLITMIKNKSNIEEIMIDSIKNIFEIEKINKYDYNGDLPVGVYTNEEIEEFDCNFILIYPSEDDYNNKKTLCINIDSKEIENKYDIDNYFEIVNFLTLILQSYETSLNIK